MENKLPSQIKVLLDGRTFRWLSEKSNIHESEISRIMSGRLIPTPNQLEKLNKALSSNLKVN
jgi:ribosome-binding protein aMBF1 (putative translation factor)